MTQKDKMLRMVLSDRDLQQNYGFTDQDFDDIYDAKDSDNAVVAAVARIILELKGSDDPSEQRRVYKTIFNYLNNNLLS